MRFLEGIISISPAMSSEKNGDPCGIYEAFFGDEVSSARR